MTGPLDRLQARWQALGLGRRLAARQFVRFLLVGLLNTATGYLVYAAGVLAGLSPGFALVGAFAFAVAFNYFTHGRVVFRQSGGAVFVRFVIAYASIYVINLFVLRLVLSFGIGPLPAQAIVLPFVVICTFAIFKFAVFKGREEDRSRNGVRATQRGR